MFIGVSDREERHGNIRKLKEKKRNDDDLRNYREWLKKASKFHNYNIFHYHTKDMHVSMYVFVDITF